MTITLFMSMVVIPILAAAFSHFSYGRRVAQWVFFTTFGVGLGVNLWLGLLSIDGAIMSCFLFGFAYTYVADYREPFGTKTRI